MRYIARKHGLCELLFSTTCSLHFKIIIESPGGKTEKEMIAVDMLENEVSFHAHAIL